MAGVVNRPYSDTIYAVTTAPGLGGVSIIRVSGPQSAAIAERLTGKDLPRAREASYRAFRDPGRGAEEGLIDKGLLLWFPAPASFTGEDIAEFHIHGGRAVAEAMLSAIGHEVGVRPAEAGEFSRRAFENGKLDLTEAEAIADLVAAETEAQRVQALCQLEGGLRRLYDDWREELTGALAYLEAGIDFADEDLPEEILQSGRDRVAAVLGQIRVHLEDGRRGEIVRRGLRIGILGSVNVGKSSLLNWLAQRDAAIVSSQAGTTRDVVEVHLDLGGFPVTIADTAGLRVAQDPVEAEGMRRARQLVAESDMRLAVFDATEWPDRDAETLALCDEDAIFVLNKCDLVGSEVIEAARDKGMLGVSVKTGFGLNRLVATLTSEVGRRLQAGAAPTLTRERYRVELRNCAEYLERALAQMERSGEVELVAEDVRLALRALGRITGRVDVEELLDVVFRDFCIGK